MSIDKSQGQSLSKVGLALESNCFSHGQFYTGISRPRDPENFMIYTPVETEFNIATNIVWKEVFPNENY